MRSKLEGNSRGVRFPMPPLLPGAGQRLQGSVQCPPRPNTCEHQTPTPAPLPAPDKSLSCEKKMLPGNVTGPGGAQVTFLSPLLAASDHGEKPCWWNPRLQGSTGLYFPSQITTRHRGLAQGKATGMALSGNYSHTS